MTRVHVAAAAAFEPGAKRIVETERGEIGVFNVDGEYYAVGNTCLHRGGPICKGKTMREIDAEDQGPKERIREFKTETPTISCPWHGWEYRLETGEHLGDDSMRLPTYDVIEEGGSLYVER